jgi:hypothetical protein
MSGLSNWVAVGESRAEVEGSGGWMNKLSRDKETLRGRGTDGSRP